MMKKVVSGLLAVLVLAIGAAAYAPWQVEFNVKDSMFPVTVGVYPGASMGLDNFDELAPAREDGRPYSYIDKYYMTSIYPYGASRNWKMYIEIPQPDNKRVDIIIPDNMCIYNINDTCRKRICQPGEKKIRVAQMYIYPLRKAIGKSDIMDVCDLKNFTLKPGNYTFYLGAFSNSKANSVIVGDI